MVIAGPGDLAALAARAYAHAAVRPDAATVDVRIAACDGDRWTVDEVTERIIAASALVPVDRTVVVVEAADQMDVAAAEHLLKTVEEPPARALFVFAVRDPDRLLPTIRGRASAIVLVHPKPARDRVADLAAAGVDPAVAREIVELAGELTAVAAAVGGNPELVGALRAGLGAPLRPDSPAADAAAIVAALGEIAKATEPEAAARLSADPDGTDDSAAGKRTERKVADAVVKARSRTLLRALLANWRRQISVELRSDDLDAERFASLVDALEQIDAADRAVGLYVTPAHLLNATLSVAPPR